MAAQIIVLHVVPPKQLLIDNDWGGVGVFLKNINIGFTLDVFFYLETKLGGSMLYTQTNAYLFSLCTD